MADALEALLRAYHFVLPGIRYISVPDYALINTAPIMAAAALRRVGRKVMT